MPPVQLGPVTHRFIQGSTGPLHAIDYGGSGTPVVCVHGVTGSAWGWADVASGIAPNRVVAVDMRGHGDSAHSPEGAYDTSDHVADLSLQIDALASQQVSLVGSSWGALVALEYCVAHPTRVSHLALVDIEPSFEATDRDVPPRPRDFDSMADVLAWVTESNPRGPVSATAALAFGAFASNAAGRMAPKHDAVFFERWPFRNDDHWEQLAEVKVPTLLVHAGYTFVRGEVMQRMHDTIPGSALVEIPDAGHVIPVDNPTALSQELRDFLGA